MDGGLRSTCSPSNGEQSSARHVPNTFCFALADAHSKTWICVTHRSRFSKPGDYISMEFAGFPVLIMLGKDHIARAFHNVCRHRAYTLTKKPAGSSLVLGCRYHGWSYDTKGSLVKAPQFDGIDGFDKAQNGLFKIHACTDRNGFIHINLDAGDDIYAPDLEDLMDFSVEHGISSNSKWLTGWEMNGAFNWKTIGASDRTGIGTSNSSAARTSATESFLSMFQRPCIDLSTFQTSFAAPVTILFAFPGWHIWATMTALPVSALQTTIKCNIYSNDGNALTPTDETKFRDFFAARIMALEDHYAATKFIRFEGVPDQLPKLKAHLQLERRSGREIYPGKRESGNSESFCKAEKLCNELDMLTKIGRNAGHARVDSVQVRLDW
ncbi:ISP domain-containing protein [Lentithecium fluviatile CBS 122367]|uniref:ISP domain-containing protein n=1 Tax=Lentithecium fluviatile CBS 122367 TaxID=1168545 RepID=A0A6G1JJ93_9PLEO|nr:ISP domain-containing protein [Lentithecium fluviatile CBS 122367]